MEIFWQTFELHHLFLLLFGLFIGIVVGALPGLTPTMGVALTIPFTFSLGATEGLVILGGIYCGSVYGGSIPAILFNVPGAPASVATTFDGYPMTKNGEARKALEVSTIASVIGGIVGMVLLLFFSPVFAEFSLKFGPTESFWIATFGLTVIAAISEGATSKNLMGGCIGVFLSFVGIHTVTGEARFTLGSTSLIGGFHVVAVLIGLFAFPQALRLIEAMTSVGKEELPKYKIKKSSLRQSFIDVLRKPRSVVVGSGMGALIGVVPGAGGNIASILAYNEVKRFSKNKDEFGKGNKNGVIASESANNAMVGGSLIPLLTLGIPGSPTAAIFLGGLLIHGVWPGRTLFVDNPDVAYTFLYSMVAAQVLLLFLGLAMVRYMTKLSQIPGYVMAPVILSFSIIGAYTMQNNVFDIFTVVLIGMFMFMLQKFNFSAAPIALGFILGPIAEEGLLHGIQVGVAQGNVFSHFFAGSINVLLYVLVTVTILFSVLQNVRINRLSQDKGVHRRWRNWVSWRSFLWLTIGVSTVLFLVSMQEMQLEQRIFPQITLLLFLLLVIIEWVKAIRKSSHSWERERFKSSSIPLLLFVSLVCLLTQVIGFYSQVLLLMISVPLYLIGIRGKKEIKVKSILFITTIFTFVLFLIFSLIIKVPLPVPLIF